jgi:hypothetical protein
MYYNMNQGEKNYISDRRHKMKKVISEVVKFFGDKMISETEKQSDYTEWPPCWFCACHEIEKPECLKKLDQERMEEK